MGRFIEDVVGFLRWLFGPVVSSLRGNAGLALLSLALAFALWIFVSDTENPVRSDVLPFDIPVDGVNPAADVAIAAAISPVRIRVEAPENIWESLTPADFQATVDLFGLGEGRHEVEVRVITDRDRVTITQIVPNLVEVTLTPLFSKSVPVVVEVLGTLPPGYQMTAPVPEVESVIVSGPEALVALVGEAVARVDVSGMTRDVAQAFRLQASDPRGRRVEGVELEPSVINVSVPIRQVQFSRLLTVSSVLTGSPAEGYNVTAISVNPVAVTVLGSQEALVNLGVVRTRPVNIEGATADVIIRTTLDLPPGVIVSGSSEVMVTVRISPALGRASFLVIPTAINLESGLSLAGVLPSVQVTLAGEIPDLQSVGTEDISAVLNLDGLGEGSHTVGVEVQPPPGLTVAGVSPAEVQVVLEAQP